MTAEYRAISCHTSMNARTHRAGLHPENTLTLRQRRPETRAEVTCLLLHVAPQLVCLVDRRAIAVVTLHCERLQRRDDRLPLLRQPAQGARLTQISSSRQSTRTAAPAGLSSPRTAGGQQTPGIREFANVIAIQKQTFKRSEHLV
jgi:hypothetical protein